MTDRIEFHADGSIIAWFDSSHAPAPGELVNIRKKTWQVYSRTYTLDHADNHRERSLCCVVTLTDLLTPRPARPLGVDYYRTAEDALMGRRWTREQADKLINLIEIGAAA